MLKMVIITWSILKMRLACKLMARLETKPIEYLGIPGKTAWLEQSKLATGWFDLEPVSRPSGSYLWNALLRGFNLIFI